MRIFRLDEITKSGQIAHENVNPSLVAEVLNRAAKREAGRYQHGKVDGSAYLTNSVFVYNEDVKVVSFHVIPDN